MRIIPRNTKVSTEFFKGVSLTDMAVGAFGVLLIFFLVLSSLPHKWGIIAGVFFFFVILLVRIDGEPNYMFVMRILKHFSYNRHYRKRPSKALSKEETDGETPTGKRKNMPKKNLKLFKSKKKTGGAKEDHEQETEESLTETE